MRQQRGFIGKWALKRRPTMPSTKRKDPERERGYHAENESSSDEVRESHGPIILIPLIYILPLIFGLSGCFGGNATTESAKQNASTTQTREINLGLGDRLKKPVEHVDPEPKPEPLDPNWPTHNPDLPAIPEADRWCNAGSKVGTYGTIAGPVGSVYQAKTHPECPSL